MSGRHPAHDFSPSDWPTPEDAWSALDAWRRARAAYVAEHGSWPTGSAGFTVEDWRAKSRLDFTTGG